NRLGVVVGGVVADAQGGVAGGEVVRVEAAVGGDVRPAAGDGVVEGRDVRVGVDRVLVEVQYDRRAGAVGRVRLGEVGRRVLVAVDQRAGGEPQAGTAGGVVAKLRVDRLGVVRP